MNRKKSDPCLLCGKRNSDKRNSHIIPKFMSSDFLGRKSKKKGYEISSDKGVIRVIQDSPKESYILCSLCEAFFSVLEGAMAQHIKGLHEKSSGAIEGAVVFESSSVSFELFHLFFYSIFWRVSISGLPTFASFKLTPAVESYLGAQLNKFNSSTKADFDQKIIQETLNTIIPYLIMTALTFPDKTQNTIFAKGLSSPWVLNADKFAFIIYENSTVVEPQVDYMFNTDNGHKRIVVVPESLWNKAMVENLFQLLHGQGGEN